MRQSCGLGARRGPSAAVEPAARPSRRSRRNGRPRPRPPARKATAARSASHDPRPSALVRAAELPRRPDEAFTSLGRDDRGAARDRLEQSASRVVVGRRATPRRRTAEQPRADHRREPRRRPSENTGRSFMTGSGRPRSVVEPRDVMRNGRHESTPASTARTSLTCTCTLNSPPPTPTRVADAASASLWARPLVVVSGEGTPRTEGACSLSPLAARRTGPGDEELRPDGRSGALPGDDAPAPEQTQSPRPRRRHPAARSWSAAE